MAVEVEPDELDRHLASLGAVWVALSPRAERPLYEELPPPPWVLVVGAERGLPRDVERRCDLALRIPMAEPVESLNTAVACALALFELRRQRGSLPDGPRS